VGETGVRQGGACNYFAREGPACDSRRDHKRDGACVAEQLDRATLRLVEPGRWFYDFDSL